MRFRKRERLEPTLNMTPLIDAVLLLLIFFAVSSSFVVQPGIRVDLPESRAGDSRPVEELRILIGAAGDLFYQGKPISIGALRERLQVHQRGPEKSESAIVQADKRVAHGKVVEVMDVVQEAGLKLIVGTTPKGKIEE